MDPKKVLEQNGINISSTDNANDVPSGDAAAAAAVGSDTKVTPSDVSSSQLALEIDSLGPFPIEQSATTATSSGAVPVTSAMPLEDTTRTRLPSFSSIIGGSPKPVEAVASTAAQGHIGDQQMTSVLSATDDMQITPASTDMAMHDATRGMYDT